MSAFDRRRNETRADHVERLFQDPWFEDAPASELAAFCGCSRDDVVKVRRQFFKRQGAKLVFEHAALIAELVEWPFDATALIHMALERYAERFTNVSQSAGRCTAEGASGIKEPDDASRKAGVASEGTPQTVGLGPYTPEASHQPSDGLPPLP
jgi:hypothetical protein